MHAYTCTRAYCDAQYVHTYVCGYAFMYVYACMHVAYVCMYTCMCVYVLFTYHMYVDNTQTNLCMSLHEQAKETEICTQIHTTYTYMSEQGEVFNIYAQHTN